MSNQKGFAKIVLIIVAVVLLGALGYVKLVKKPIVLNTTDQSQSSELEKQQINEMDNWKTYRNERFGFEVKYPEKWREESCSSSNEACASFYPPGKKRGEGFITYEGDVVIVTAKLPNNFSTEGFLKEFNDYLFNKSQKYESITLDGEKSFYFQNISNLISEPDIVVIPHTHKGAYIWIENISEEKIFNQILSTFKFTE